MDVAGSGGFVIVLHSPHAITETALLVGAPENTSEKISCCSGLSPFSAVQFIKGNLQVCGNFSPFLAEKMARFL
jgi:hypothetical protein